MNPNTYTGPSSMAQVMNELHRAKTNEKRLMDQNKAQKIKLSSLITVEMSLKKEQLEVAMLKNKARSQDLHVDQLRKDLEKAKACLKHEEAQRAYEKNASEQKIMSLEKDQLQLKNKFSIEKTLREQKEKELETFSNIRGENKKLSSYGQTLHHQVQELTGFRNFATKKLEEQNQLLKKKDAEHDQTKQELDRIRQKFKYYKERVEKLTPLKDRLECVQKVAEKQANEIKKHKQQADTSKKTTHLLKKEAVILTRKIEELSIMNSELEHQMDQLRQDKSSLTLTIQNHVKEAEKQRNLLLNLENELNSFSDVKTKLQNKEKEITRHTAARDREIINLRNLISESESMQRMQIIQTEAVKTERNLIAENLFKAETELSRMNKTIQQLHLDIRDKTCEVNTKSADLVKTNRERRSVKNQLEKMKSQLAEAKMIQQICVVSASQDQKLAKDNLARLTAEKEMLDKGLVCYKEMVVQLQQKIEFQKAHKVTQEQLLRDLTEEVNAVKLEITRLERDHFISKLTMLREIAEAKAQKARRARIRGKRKNPHPCLQMMYNEHREYQFFGRKAQLEKKDKEIEELKRMLSRRPDEAIQKLQRCQWDNRDLSKQLKASKGLLTAYEAKYKSENEENKRLTDELRKLNLESREKSRNTRFSPISKPQAPSEDKSKDQQEPRHISRHTRFPLSSTKSRHQSEDKSKVAPVSPIFNVNIQCSGRKIRPHPPP